MSTTSSYFDGPNKSDFGIDIGFTRTYDLLSTTSTDEGTSNLVHANKIDNEEGSEIDNDPI